MKMLTGFASATMLLAGSAHAQDGGLTADEVRGFLEPLGAQAQRAVEDGNWRGIQKWFQEHLAEDANFAAEGSVMTKGGLVMTYAIVFDREDLRRFVNPAMMSLQQGSDGKALQDYTLGTDVQDIMELPDGEASAIVTFRESGTIDPSEAGGLLRGAEGIGGELGPVTFQTTSTCDLRLSQDGQDGIRIELAACTSNTSL